MEILGGKQAGFGKACKKALEAAIIPPASIPSLGKLAGQPRQGEMIESGNLFAEIPDVSGNEQFLDLCDELGLYVRDELAGWHNKYDNEIGPKLVHEMVVRRR